MNRRQYIVIRMVATDELRIAPVAHGYIPPADPEYTWAGPYKSQAAANKAIQNEDAALMKQLYPTGKTK
jgi:hypothetical protein